MKTFQHVYSDDQDTYHGFVAYDDQTDHKRPGVLIAHDWSGQNDFAREKAIELAHLGYVGFALDIYGQGKTGETIEEKQALMQPLMQNRTQLQQRMLHALAAAKDIPQIDTNRLAVLGFCFGGLCALDLARSGVDFKAVASFHGLLHKSNLETKPIIPSLLVLHGYDDPMVSFQEVHTFCDEMTMAKADWQFHAFSQTQHAFMVPTAHDATRGIMYQARTADRAWQMTLSFLEERCK